MNSLARSANIVSFENYELYFSNFHELSSQLNVDYSVLRCEFGRKQKLESRADNSKHSSLNFSQTSVTVYLQQSASLKKED